MGRTCAVLGCTNKKGSFHRFPSKDIVLRDLLISVTGQRKFDKNWMPNHSSRLCSDHYTTKNRGIRHNGRSSNPTLEVLTQPMSYQCSHCPAAFSLEHDLKEHKSIAHQTVPFQCLQCPSVYSSENTFKQHLAIAHQHNIIAIVDEKGVQGVSYFDTNKPEMNPKKSKPDTTKTEHDDVKLAEALKELAEAKERLHKSETENKAMKESLIKESERSAMLEKEIDSRDAFIEQEARHITAAENFLNGDKNVPVEFLRHKCKLYREQLSKKRLNEHRLRNKLFRIKKIKTKHDCFLAQEKVISKCTFLEDRYEGAKLQVMKDILRPTGKQRYRFKHPKKYSQEARDFAIGIHYRSPSTYEHLRSTVCLPTQRSIRKLLSSADCSPGKMLYSYDSC